MTKCVQIKRSKKFQVFLNDDPIPGAVIAGNLIDAKRWVKQYVLSTHMGEWRRTSFGIEYATTIGRYYQFRILKKGASI